MKIFKVVFVFLLVLSANAIARAQCVPASTAAGALDTCFDGDGKVVTDITPLADFVAGVVVQPDGKIVVAGTVGADSTGAADFGVVRYNRDGSLDTTFDGDGIAITDIGSQITDLDFVRGVVLQADGKIVVFGEGQINGAAYGFAAVRYNTDGSLDTTYSGDGRATWVPSSQFMEARAVAIQPDGKIVGAGRIMQGDTNRSVVMRFTTDGSLDLSFDGDGSRIGTFLSDVRAVVVQPDGKIVVAGALGSDMGIARFNPDGSPDPFFGAGGVAIYDANLADRAFGMALRLDGSIFAVGTAATATGTYGSIVRFNTIGTTIIGTPNFDDNSFIAAAIQSDLKVLTAGSSRTPLSNFTVRRHIEVTRDNSFNGGAATVKFFPEAVTESSGVAAIATGRDNRIVAAGTTTEAMATTGSKFAVARLMSGLLAPHAERFDFDGDGKADVSVFRPSENRWYVFRSSDFGVTEQFFGESGDRAVPADYDGDGKTDFGIFRSGGTWRWLSSISGAENGFQWGSAGDVPRVSDFNGDGAMDFVLFRPSQNIWYRKSLTGEFSNQNFGLTGDKPVAGDFDGDGKSDKAIFRPSTGDWWYQSSINNAQLAVHWGISTDIPSAGDYDGDGKTDFAVYRPETGIWYIINSSNFSFTIINFGLAEDKPVPADYDGDGKVDIAVFRPSTGVWYMLRSSAGFAALQFGISTDVPAPNAYIN